MNERIKAIRTNAKLSQADFGAKINVSQNYIWMIEKGDRVPSDRTIADICREFNVNETWLRTGDGEMMKELTRNQEIAEFLGKVMNDPDDAPRKRFISIISKLDVEEWMILDEIAKKWAQGK